MIYELIEKLSVTSSTNAKKSILEANKDNEVLKMTFQSALDKTKKYYIKKIPQYENVSNDLTLLEGIKRLDKLVDRTYTGNNAIAYVKDTLSSMESKDAKVLENIIDRDLKCGVSGSTVNKIWKDLIPKFPYMRLSLISEVKLKKWNFSKGLYSQLKCDGSFANINHTGDGEVEIITRQGEVYPLDYFDDIVVTIQNNFELDRQYHGELLIERDGVILERSIGNGILTSVRRGGELPSNCRIVYHVWDYVQLSTLVPKGSYHVEYNDRYNNLKSMVREDSCIALVETRIIYNIDEAIDHLETVVAEGLEGTVLKDGNGIWEDKTSKNCIKLKIVADGIDLEIIGYTEGKNKNKELFGSVMCQSSDGLLRVNISGFTDEMRLYIHNNRERLIGTIMTVKANTITEPSKNNEYYSLFLPRFEELREGDKDVADDLPRIQEIIKLAILDVKQQLLDAMK